jgi:hypothetical protein
MRVVLLISLLIALIVTALQPVAHGQVADDVAGHWAEERISVLVRRGIAQRFPDLSFRPQDQLSRAEYVRWLITAIGLQVRPVLTPSFVDVLSSHPAAPFIETALGQGIIPRALTFLPDVPVTRIDAVAMAVRAIGYTFEATVLAMQPLPFEDVAALPEVQRGLIAVAQLTEPALLREPATPAFRPQEPMTRGEGASLVGGVLLAVENGLLLHTATPVAGGVNLVIEKRGVLRMPALWRVQVGAFTSEANAERLAARMRERGMPTVVDFQDGFYKVRVGSFSTAAEATAAKEQLGREGYPTFVVQTLRSFESIAGPSREAALLVDPAAGVTIAPALGDGGRMRPQRTSEISRRTRALAAANGGFFAASGDPLGCLMIAGEVISEPDPLRSCVGITREGSIVIDRVAGELLVIAGEASGRIDGVNRMRRVDELILYRPLYEGTTRTNNFGVEAVIVNGVVTQVRDQRGNTPIPRDGLVLSGHGRARQWILNTLQPGVQVGVHTEFVSPSGDPRWQQVLHAVGGGPRLLRAGQFVGGEGFLPSFTDRRHPRTALGVLDDGRIVLLVVDGRQPTHSLGMTLFELAVAMKRLGAVEAINLDGGGSSTLVVGTRVMNRPSDENGERPVADALVVVPAQGP